MNESKNWYYQVNSELVVLANMYSLPLETVVGIFVTLSSQTPYNKNMELCKQFLKTHNVKGMNVSKTKLEVCKAILAGVKPLEIWAKTSHKYKHFYHSILLIDGYPCIDTHMIKMYLELHPYSILFDFDINTIFKSKRLLNPIIKWIEKQAKDNNVKLFEMQSILWVEQRGGKMF